MQEKMILVIDESGAKGYATTREKEPNEIGVMAGFFYHEDDIKGIEKLLAILFDPHRDSTSGKIHITDLDKEEQELIRKKSYYFIKKEKFRWLFNAIYAEGFHQSVVKRTIDDEKNTKESLHSTLFKNILCLCILMAHEQKIEELKIEVRTDNVDPGVLKDFKKQAESIIAIFTRNETQSTIKIKSAIPSERKKIVLHSQLETDAIPKFKKIELNFICVDSNLTLLADILANTTRFYLSKSIKDKTNGNGQSIYLNNKEILKEHPVIEYALAAEDESHATPLLDIIYRRETSVLETSKSEDQHKNDTLKARKPIKIVQIKINRRKRRNRQNWKKNK